jgi:very-short-patch-repair endonuclease
MTIKECKSYNEMGQVLGYGYYNGRVKKAIIEFCVLNNLDPDEIIRENSKKPNKCLYCGKELEGKGKYTKKFCDSSCAASYNNKGRTHSEETKFKIKSSLHKKNVERNNKNHPKIRKCVICGKDFIVSKKANGSYSRTSTCSDECHHTLISNRGKEVMNKLISEGRHIGWQSRNIISYPEQFWMKVLENNNIDYKHNFFIKDRHYFLDFLININDKKIDLEIDGKQHKYEDRVGHDIERDKNLKEDGYLIYRVEWNTINTEEGSEKMKNKIIDFINFIEECKNN